MPYNAYEFHETNIEETLTPYHVNQDFLRYELVNVNIIQKTDLKSDKRHIIPHRTMYFDLDSHNMLVEETYDDENEIMAYREFPIINFMINQCVYQFIVPHMTLLQNAIN